VWVAAELENRPSQGRHLIGVPDVVLLLEARKTAGPRGRPARQPVFDALLPHASSLPQEERAAVSSA